jgi:hypothetical protein
MPPQPQLETEMSIQRTRDECIEEEETKAGRLKKTLHKVIVEEVDEPIVSQPSLLHEPKPLNIAQGGFIATYNLGKMPVEYLVELQAGCLSRLSMAQHDLGAVTAELAFRSPVEVTIERQPWESPMFPPELGE